MPARIQEASPSQAQETPNDEEDNAMTVDSKDDWEESSSDSGEGSENGWERKSFHR
jgi:hypothetical protein